MEKFLIDTNQCQAFGITIYDEPTDQNRPLGIETDFNTHIPMLMIRSICGFITQYPKDDKINKC